MLIARFLREVLTPEEAAADKEGYEADAPTDGGPRPDVGAKWRQR